jgi:hypothetical protein
MEHIYGIYSDLMKVGEYVGGPRPPPLNQAATRLAWDMSHMAISDDSTSESASSNAMYQDGRRQPLPVAVARQLSPVDGPREQAAGDHLTGVAEQELIAGEQAYSEAGIYDRAPSSPRSAQLKLDQRQEPIYGTSSPEPMGSHKTALLLTGGNGYKRGTQDSPYSSQHAHCIIWEYKL